MRFSVLMIHCCVLLGGCSTIQDLAKSPGERARARELEARRACDGSEPKEWDLGTGRAQDIRLRASGFYALRELDQPILYENQVALANHENDRRLEALRAAERTANGWRLESVQVDRVAVEDVVPAETIPLPGARVRAVGSGSEALLIVTPDECPHFVATDKCIDDRFVVEIRREGTVPCIGPYSVENNGKVHVSGYSNELGREVQIGKPTNASVTSSVFVFVHENAPPVELGVSRGVNNVAPEEVLGALSWASSEKVPAVLYGALDPKWRTPELDAEIVKIRVKNAKENVAAVKTRPAVIKLMQAHLVGKGLPGDSEVKAILQPKLEEVTREMAREGLVQEMPVGLLLLAALRIGGAVSIDETASAFEEHYGPLVAEGKVAPRDAKSFAIQFPASKYTAELQERLDREREERKSVVVAREQASLVESLWEDVEYRGDQLATLAYKIRFGDQHLPKTRHNVRELNGMRSYRRGLVTESFCPAKREFIEAASVGEYLKRAKEHCDEEAPVDGSVGGDEVTLTNDCRVAFATGC